jgi:hypothetical protein
MFERARSIGYDHFMATRKKRAASRRSRAGDAPPSTAKPIYGDNLDSIVAKAPFCRAVEAMYPQRADALIAEVQRYCYWFGDRPAACACCGRRVVPRAVFAWMDGENATARAFHPEEAPPPPAVCRHCVEAAIGELDGAGPSTEQLITDLGRAMQRARLVVEAQELERVLARRPRMGGSGPCILCAKKRTRSVRTPTGSLCARCVHLLSTAIRERRCYCPDVPGSWDPDRDPNLIETDSRCFLHSQSHSSGYDEIWKCLVCGKRWHVSVYRDGDCRNGDPPRCELLPADHPDTWPESPPG